jgi:NADH-quinone oxidoreductase subunit L
MLWYGVFFGNHERMNAWFGIPAHEVAGAVEPEAENAPPATAEAPAAPAGEAAAPAPADEHAAELGPIGAVFFGPDNETIERAHEAPALVKVSPFLAMLVGLVVAYWFYIVNPALPVALARNQPVLYRFLLNKWYFDEIYDFLFVRPARWLGTVLWKGGDLGAIDGTLNGVAMGIVPWFTRLAGRWQSGYLFHYAFAMVLGLLVLTLWLGIGAGGR